MKQLCTIDDIRSLRPIAKEISADRIDPFIVEAQENDIAPLLGAGLYADLMLKFDNDADPMYANYQTLLRGDVYYTPSGANYAVRFRGLWVSVAYLALGRFLRTQQINITRFGAVVKTNTESEPLTPEALNSLIESINSNAYVSNDSIVDYLNSNSATYTKWNGSNGKVERTGVKFFDV